MNLYLLFVTLLLLWGIIMFASNIDKTCGHGFLCLILVTVLIMFGFYHTTTKTIEMGPATVIKFSEKSVIRFTDENGEENLLINGDSSVLSSTNGVTVTKFISNNLFGLRSERLKVEVK